LSPRCVNRAGPMSRIRLEAIPALGQPLHLGADSRRALQCWDLRIGEACTVSDPEGNCYRARLSRIAADTAVLTPYEMLGRTMESPLDLEIYQALPQKERFELVLQKLAELGVTRIIPFTSQRSITQEERDAGQRKSHRWPEVLLRAAKQCRRAEIPELSPTRDWDAAVCAMGRADLRLFLHENGAVTHRLHEVLQGQRPQRVALLVGPEGGLTSGEALELRSAGCLPVSIGPRILRTETASIVGAALIQYVLGDLS